MYVLMASLTGEVFVIEYTKVHTIITTFVAVNDETKAIMQALIAQVNVLPVFISLLEHYEGVLVNYIDTTKSEGVI